MDKPRQSFWGLWNISFGYFGIQMAFGLQNANVSRIFQSLGSNVDELAFLWIAGPVTGLIIQPLIGHYSDRTWGRFGRRRPYFLVGALFAALAMIGMPNAGLLLAAALLLWVLDASLNVSMEPFRAFVGDMTNKDQRAQGFAFQTAFIGSGAVIGSVMPILLNHMGVANTAAEGIIPPSVRFAFYIGAAAIVLAVAWTVFTTKEYAPEQLAAFGDADHAQSEEQPLVRPANGLGWMAVGAVLLALVWHYGLDKQLYILGAVLAAFGALQIGNRVIGGTGAIAHILSDLTQMPQAMRRLALAQFFTWLALFIMWIYTTPVVTQYVFGSTDTTSALYNQGADWVGVLFSIYNGVAALAAFALPLLAKRIGNAKTHMLGLLAGAAGYAAILIIRDANLLILPMIGVGIAWASILTMPYVILTEVLPQKKLGIYIGIFNFFIVLPQLLVASIMGGIIRAFFPTEPIWTMAVAAVVMGIAALTMLRVRD